MVVNGNAGIEKKAPKYTKLNY